jgi:predicted O-methyltransferase YrrM
VHHKKYANKINTERENMLPIDIETVKGFIDSHEGAALYQHALNAAQLGPIVEVGSYCGKSTVYLGAACKLQGSLLYAVDHHRGSEEHQQGEEYHDPELYDAKSQRMDSLPTFLNTLMRADLVLNVIPIVAPSTLAARYWNTPLGMVFVDGGHSMAAALEDYRCWVGHIMRGGLLAIHDVFPDPNDGGRPPYEIWQLAQSSGLFKALPLVNSLGVLVRC